MISMHDPRLDAATDVIDSIAVKQDFESAFTACLQRAELMWLIAPECDDILFKLTQLCEQTNVALVGAPSEIVALATDKLKTAAWLTANQLKTPVTLSIAEWQVKKTVYDSSQPWLAKPINGVGCEGIVFLDDMHAVDAWLSQQTQATLSDYFLQLAVQSSQPASLSLLCHNGRASLLSCNRLITEQENDAIKLNQIEVNGFADYWTTFQKLADTIAQALPTLRAYLGVDVMFDPQTGEISVLELNPRLSSSYVGLAEATCQNIAQCLLDAYFQADYTMPEILHRPVIVDLE